MSFVDFLAGLPLSLAGGAAVLAICIAVELVASRDRYTLSDRWRGLVFTLAGSLSAGLAAWALQCVWTGNELGRWLVLPVYQWLKPLGWLGYVGSIFASVAAYDFFSYWRHRAEHKWFWRIHALHHSPTELHAANNWSHPLAIIPGFLFLSLPVSLIQMPGPSTPTVIALLISFLAAYIHSPVDFHFGPLRRVVIDNRFHRIHHSVEARHVDKNFGILFSFWDGLFGTAHWPERQEWPKVGIRETPPSTLAEFFLYPSAVDQLPPASAGGDAREQAGLIAPPRGRRGVAFLRRPVLPVVGIHQGE